MKLIFLGTAGYHPSERRHTSCLMLPEAGIVLDAGTGMFRVRDRIATAELDIFLTHAHLDHVVGLTFLIDVLYEKPVDRVTVHATPDALEAIHDHLLDRRLFPAPLPCDYRPLDGPVELPGGGRLTHFPLVHPGGSTGLRLDWPDRSLAYVTDTTADPDAAYVASLQGVDLLVHECNFTDELADLAHLTGHSCTTAVAEVARRADAGRAILTHVNPLAPDPDPVNLAAARAVFPRVELARDLLEVEF